MAAELERVDAIVIGGNMRGLVSCYVLDRLGYRAVLLERGKAIGGVDRSFTVEDGTTFDYGMHVLDEDRSTLATRLFRREFRVASPSPSPSPAPGPDAQSATPPPPAP